MPKLGCVCLTSFNFFLYNVILFLPGGVTLLRAAAKNHARVTVICDPVDYSMYVYFELPSY